MEKRPTGDCTTPDLDVVGDGVDQFEPMFEHRIVVAALLVILIVGTVAVPRFLL